MTLIETPGGIEPHVMFPISSPQEDESLPPPAPSGAKQRARKLIVVVSGKIKSGKNTFCNMVAAEWLNRRAGELQDLCVVGEDGALRAGAGPAINLGPGLKDPPLQGPNGIRFLSFADPLKEFCVNVLGLRHEQCWGAQADKDTETHIRWESLPITIRLRYRKRWWLPVPRRGAMTGREVMQVFGTDIVRAMYPRAWAAAAYRKACEVEEPVVAICDGRFPDEIDAGRKVLGNSAIIRTVRLLRSVSAANSDHPSETALDDFPLHDFSLVLGPRATLDDYRRAARSWVVDWLREAGLLNRQGVN